MSTSLDSIFRPRSVAVVGATNRPGTIGRELLANLLRSEFTGKVFPVNPNQPVVLCMKSYASVLEIEDEVDLAVILVAKQHVLQVVDECGRKGVGGLVIITAGFKEVGGEGGERELALRRLLTQHGIRAVGPNCMGVINTDPEFSLNATFSRVKPPSGNVGFMTQSGALGDAIIAHAAQVGIGFSMFASVGNKADVSANDLLTHWGDDPRTEVILLYLESFGAPRKFTTIVRGISREKAVVAVKAGRSDAGARAAFSHTGSLAGLDAGVDALFEQCGVIRASTVGELFDVALALSCQPVPKGNRVAIITNAGGPGIMATDACARLGLEVPELAPETRKRMSASLRAEASVRNPVDVIASGGPADYAVSIDACADDPGVDALIVIFIPPVMINAPAVAEAIAGGVERMRARGIDKPVLTCFMNAGPAIDEAVALLRAAHLPIYLFPESATTALAAMVARGRWLDKPKGERVEYPVERGEARTLVDEAAREGRTVLTSGEARRLLEVYGVPVAARRVTASMEEAVSAAQKIGYPVVLKIEAASLVHKTDVGGVVADIRNAGELVDGYTQLREVITTHALVDATILVQSMITGGREVILGMTKDPSFGPLLMFGLGGVDVEVLHDVCFRIHPITDLDAGEMVRSVRARRLLEGYRGEPAADLVLLESMLLRLSQMVGDLPEIEQVEINPFLITAPGGRSSAVDARILLSGTPTSALEVAPQGSVACQIAQSRGG